MTYWFSSYFNPTPVDVFFRPFSFDPRVRPRFYESLILAWRSLDGSFSVGRSSLVMGSSSPHTLTPAIGITSKSCYQYLLSENLGTSHCVVKFLPTFVVLYLSTTWRELFFLDTDCQVIDLSWKIAHGVLYTAARLASFGYDFNTSCFGFPVSETHEHLFFHCPLAYSAWLQSLMFISSPLIPSLVCLHALFGFSPDELLVVPRFLSIFLMSVNSSSGTLGMIFVFVHSSWSCFCHRECQDPCSLSSSSSFPTVRVFRETSLLPSPVGGPWCCGIRGRWSPCSTSLVSTCSSSFVCLYLYSSLWSVRIWAVALLSDWI